MFKYFNNVIKYENTKSFSKIFELNLKLSIIIILILFFYYLI